MSQIIQQCLLVQRNTVSKQENILPTQGNTLCTQGNTLPTRGNIPPIEVLCQIMGAKKVESESET